MLSACLVAAVSLGFVTSAVASGEHPHVNDATDQGRHHVALAFDQKTFRGPACTGSETRGSDKS